MRCGLDVKSCVKYYRANPHKKLPLYLQWLQLKFQYLALKLSAQVNNPKPFINRLRLKINKRERDRVRRRLMLDARIGKHYKICWNHGEMYFPLCRSRMSDFFPHRRCSECQYEKELKIDVLAEKNEKRLNSVFGWGEEGWLPYNAT